MRIVVSGTHASGKTSLIDAFGPRHPEFEVLPDPIEVLGDHPTDAGAGVFFQQLQVAAARLLEPAAHSVIAERGPLDFLAHLEALDLLGRPVPSRDHFERGVDLCADAMRRVDLVVLLPLEPDDPIWVPAEEDPDLRHAMDERLVDLCGDTELTGSAAVVELAGPLPRRLAALEDLVRGSG